MKLLTQKVLFIAILSITLCSSSCFNASKDKTQSVDNLKFLDSLDMLSNKEPRATQNMMTCPTIYKLYSRTPGDKIDISELANNQKLDSAGFTKGLTLLVDGNKIIVVTDSTKFSSDRFAHLWLKDGSELCVKVLKTRINSYNDDKSLDQD